MLIIRYTTNPTDTDLSEDQPSVPKVEDPHPGPAGHVSGTAPGLVSEPDPSRARALEEFAREVADGKVPSIRTIRTRLRVGQPKAQELQAHLTTVVANGQQQEQHGAVIITTGAEE